MVDTSEGLDFFDDGDLADPVNLPNGEKFLGVVKEVNVDGMTPGNEVTWKDGTKHPTISFTIEAKRTATGDEIDPKYMRQAKVNFNLGKNDTMSRNIFANLVAKLKGVTKNDLAGIPITKSAKECLGGKVSFVVKWTEGDDITFQNFNKVKAATAEEEKLMV